MELEEERLLEAITSGGSEEIWESILGSENSQGLQWQGARHA